MVNRPATAEEIAALIDSMNAIDDDHAELTRALQEREKWWVERKPQLENERLAAIAKATEELESYQKEIAPRVAEDEKKRQAGIAAAQAELKKFTDELPKHVAAWEAKNKSSVEWHFLEPDSLTPPNGIQLQRLEDRSVRATGTADAGAYTIVASTQLQAITGLRIEAMTDETIKGGGPGLPENGNFVVTEFEVQAAPIAKPTELKKVELQNAKADYLQDGFNIVLTADGNAGNQNGWAIANSGGVVHWATYETKTPVANEGGTQFKIVIHQNHNATGHLLGRFRISVTTDKTIGLSLPESLKSVISTPAEQRVESQTNLVTAYFDKTDATLLAKRTAVGEASKPLPEDPGVTKRKATLQFVSVAVPEDSRLLRLRSDVEYSKQQVTNKRLTAAQDLTWALINNPSFLFNR